MGIIESLKYLMLFLRWKSHEILLIVSLACNISTLHKISRFKKFYFWNFILHGVSDCADTTVFGNFITFEATTIFKLAPKSNFKIEKEISQVYSINSNELAHLGLCVCEVSRYRWL